LAGISPRPEAAVAAKPGWTGMKAACFAAAALCSLLALASHLGRLLTAADSLNYLAPAWLVPGLATAAAVVILRIGRRWVGWAMLLVLAVTTLDRLRPGQDGFETLGASVPPTVTIVQFNVWKDNRDPDAAAAWILARRPDIVVLEEAAREGGRIRDRLRGRFPYATDCLGAAGRCSTIILSSRSPLRAAGLARGDPENRGGLSAAWAEFEDPQGPFTVVAAHLSRPWPFGSQRSELSQLQAFLKDRDRDRLIMLGDFNQTPWTFAMRRLETAVGMRRRTGTLFTWPIRYDRNGRRLPGPAFLPLDHVFAGPGWASHVERGPPLGSDHYPLLVKLAPTGWKG
jgi:endonuclease/exonuclease/phosphatase (EEP) superfamily protein YafD